MLSRAEQIQSAIQKSLSPSHLSVIDESHLHSRGAETHFKAVIVSDRFAGLSRVRRQQLVYQSLQTFFDAGLHALSLTTATPDEWQSGAVSANQSPACQHK